MVMPLTAVQVKELLDTDTAMLGRVRALFPDPAEYTAFTTLLVANNPSTATEDSTRKGFDVIMTSVERRVKSHNPNSATLGAVFATLPQEKIENLAGEFQSYISRCLAEWSSEQPKFKADGKTPLSAVYHRGPHGAEMSHDAGVLLKSQAERLFVNNSAMQKAYLEMAKAAHAIHDIIQIKGPPVNEIESYERYMQGTDSILKKLDLTPEQHKELRTVIDKLAWETIVVGTVFHFPSKQPLVDILNDFAVTTKKDDLKHSDPAIACAAFSAGKNDTRRMDLKMGFNNAELLNAQTNAVGGAGNMVVNFFKNNTDRAGQIAATHLAGQNVRMICEGNTHFSFGNQEKIAFAANLANLIEKASTAFTQQQRDELLTHFDNLPNEQFDKYFELLMTSYTNPFGEIAFAAGIKEDIYIKATENFSELYPDNQFHIPKNGDMWVNYAENLKKFITEFQAKVNAETDPKVQKDLKIAFFRDLALLGAHQVGSFLLRNDKNYLVELKNISKELHSQINELTTKGNTSSPEFKALQEKVDKVDHDIQLITSQKANEKQMKHSTRQEGLVSGYKLSKSQESANKENRSLNIPVPQSSEAKPADDAKPKSFGKR